MGDSVGQGRLSMCRHVNENITVASSSQSTRVWSDLQRSPDWATGEVETRVGLVRFRFSRLLGLVLTLTMLDADVLLQVLFFLPQGDIASVARSSQWLWNVAQSALYQHPLTRGIPRAYSLARTVSDTRCTLSVKSMHLCALGAGEATTTAQWNDVQDAILRALRSTSCVALERFKIDIVLPSFMHNARAAWGEPIWGVLRESCPKLRWIEVNHNAFNGETQVRILPLVEAALIVQARAVTKPARTDSLREYAG